jgi:RHS repeat-associated protein
MTAIRENGGFVLASFGYDGLGRRTSLTRGNGTVTSYQPDAVSRLETLTHTFPASAVSAVALGFTYNPAGQIASNTRTNDLFAWTGSAAGTTPSAANGLNQLTQAGAVVPTYDGRGNMTANGTATFGYTAENRLTSSSGGNFYYDPLGRLAHLTAGGTDFLYDGGELIQEMQSHGGPTRRRYVHGPGSDEPLVWYEGAGTTDRRYLHADERGSVVAVSDGTGTVLGINKYDEYGVPAACNIGSFGYTGQVWLPELGLWHYKARMYDPKLGRFLQPDPIGYDDGLNMYAYVGGDPVNSTDPTGLSRDIRLPTKRRGDPPPTGSLIQRGNGALCGSCSGSSGRSHGGVAGVGSPGGGGRGRAAGSDSSGASSAIIVTGFRISGSALDDVLRPIAAGSYMGSQTFGENPSLGQDNRFYPDRRINSRRPGGFRAALGDLDYLSRMNRIKMPSPTGLFQNAAHGWVPSYNIKTSYNIYTHGPTGLEFRFNGQNTVITIPMGFQISERHFLVTPHKESVHYSGW